MANSSSLPELPRPTQLHGKRMIPPPDITSFTSRFGDAFPTPKYITSEYGQTAVYDLPPLSGQSSRNVLFVHGLGTPALGMLPLAKELQSIESGAHIVIFDLWGHGLSSTPLVAHTPAMFHSQILQVLSYLQWTQAELVGFSFGGSTAVSFSLHNPQVIKTVVLIAPAGLLSFDAFSPEMQGLLKDSTGRSEEARDCVHSFLEGGPLTLPADWQEQSRAGQIVAPALRDWQHKSHAGYGHSVLSMFRDGGVWGCEDNFRNFSQLPFPIVAVLGELDDVATSSQLEQLGFTSIKVVSQAAHDLVRSHKADVAKEISTFWSSRS